MNSSLLSCKGIGPAISSKLEKLNIQNITDLMFYFPRKYQDRRRVNKIKDLKNDETSSVFVEVLSSKTNYFRGGCATYVEAKDETGGIRFVWFGQPYLQKNFKKGVKLFAYGKAQIKVNTQMTNPEYEIIKDEDEDNRLHIGRIVPIYRLTKGVSNKILRKIINNALDGHKNAIDEFLPALVLKDKKFPDIEKALLNIHFPEDFSSLAATRERFVYEELFFLMLALKYSKNIVKFTPRVFKYNADEKIFNDFITGLPFNLTGAQEKVFNEVALDLKKDAPMQRLLVGDVGCGKTVVAAFACYLAALSGHQAAYMAPTEILAVQHYENLSALLERFGVKTVLLTSSSTKDKKDKELIYGKIKNKEFDFIIGTHSLIQESVKFNNLGLVVIDEQHKFGVNQRFALRDKAKNPDLLIMTATPIPRTLAVSVFADMDVSVIDELPPGRKKINTYFVPFSYGARAYEFIRKNISAGRQAFIVCPMIDEDEQYELKAVQTEYKKLKEGEFKNFKVAFLHGRMKGAEKEIIMTDFKNKKIDILVATTVIEVGIDIQNANIMLVKNAERFGFAQLHQLRGRIGRGEHESYCILMSDAKEEEVKARLKSFCKENDGFKIAQLDLQMRGTGEFFGNSQHGFSEFKIADPLRDIKILEQAKRDAEMFLAQDKFLQKEENKLLKNKIVNIGSGIKL